MTTENVKTESATAFKFKATESVHIAFFKPGVKIGPIVRKLPVFLTLSGTVGGLLIRDSVNWVSIKFPRMPIRYLIEEERCFHTKEAADNDTAAKNVVLKNQLRQDGFRC